MRNKKLYTYLYRRHRDLLNNALPSSREYLSLEDCLNISAKFKYRQEWLTEHRKSYETAARNGWLEKCCQNMILKTGYLNDKNKVAEIAKKYNTRGDFSKNANGAYRSATRNGWLDDVCAHMDTLIHTDYTFQQLEDSAKKFTRLIDWQKK